MTIWTMIAAIAMVMWAISLALAMGPIWARTKNPSRKGQSSLERRIADRFDRRRSAPANGHTWVV